eukprot:CAMPEP_0168337702 /NCGR_PEP_ID=MMETSP0213-20121227/12359_1 /TAXON_ID=151035 /ORGANISM="Euplotes harpa, Strain FSP1.4" /LENGTH=232 /DNA_ID=CAMNT_0008343265 /DNA_START=259 /DNA_END=958 /DNA_ORIENTATION=+
MDSPAKSRIGKPPLNRHNTESKKKPDFKRAGFFVQKLRNKLTVPRDPNITSFKKKPVTPAKLNKKSLRDLDKLSFNISIPIPKQLGRGIDSSIKKTFRKASGCGSTNTSMTRGSSPIKPASTKFSATRKSIDMKSLGTHSDNFLCSFISLRDAEKEQVKAKSRHLDVQVQESWFKEITNVSFDSELREDEYKNIVKDIISTPQIDSGAFAVNFKQRSDKEIANAGRIFDFPD